MTPSARKARAILQSLRKPGAETTNSYLLIAATLLIVLALGLVAIATGAIDSLNASGLLGG